MLSRVIVFFVFTNMSFAFDEIVNKLRPYLNYTYETSLNHSLLNKKLFAEEIDQEIEIKIYDQNKIQSYCLVTKKRRLVFYQTNNSSRCLGEKLYDFVLEDTWGLGVFRNKDKYVLKVFNLRTSKSWRIKLLNLKDPIKDYKIFDSPFKSSPFNYYKIN